MNDTIAVVGGGSTSVSFIYHYLKQHDLGCDLPRTIYLCEKRGSFGPGAAYDDDLGTNILNTKCGFITPFDDKPSDFFHWLSQEEQKWRPDFQNFKLDVDSYAPRPLFGKYLQSRMGWLIKEAAARSINILQINAEVVDVHSAGKNYIISTDCHLTLKADYIFFFCGTMPAKMASIKNNSSVFIQSPYPIKELPRRVGLDSAVAIVGSRLGCIDAVIGLVKQGHTGEITIHSRSGFFPSVRGSQGRIKNKVLTVNTIDALVKEKGKLQISDLALLVRKEISLQDNIPLVGFELPVAPTDILKFLRSEIESASKFRTWQAVLYTTNLIIDKMWSSLRDEDKSEFLSKYFSIFMAYRVSIPVENAKLILSYMESGQVKFRSGAFEVESSSNGNPVIEMKANKSREILKYDYVINATGSPRDVMSLDSNLIEQMLSRGMMSAHDFGGVQVDTNSYQLINSLGGVQERLYVVGELTSGAFFFTSALDINARHAKKCVEGFSLKLSSAQQEVSFKLA